MSQSVAGSQRDVNAMGHSLAVVVVAAHQTRCSGYIPEGPRDVLMPDAPVLERFTINV